MVVSLDIVSQVMPILELLVAVIIICAVLLVVVLAFRHKELKLKHDNTGQSSVATERKQSTNVGRIFCRYCGASNETNAVFCKECGQKIA